MRSSRRERSPVAPCWCRRSATPRPSTSGAIQAGRTPAACGQLSAFRHEVRGFWGRVLTPALARQLDVDALWTETSLGCEGRAVAPTSAASARSGALQLTKECSEYTGLAGSVRTITASSIKQIVVGTRIVYGQPAGATSVDSDVMLDMPGPETTPRSATARRTSRPVSGCARFPAVPGSSPGSPRARTSRTRAAPASTGTGPTASVRASEPQFLDHPLSPRGAVTGLLPWPAR